ncbi:RNA recognition motif [Gracilaria domingensis]|nr:RNA recognition motif [Gracilaria domingensis]
MVNEHVDRDAEWSHDRLRDPRPGKKPRLSVPDEPPLSPPPPPRPAPPPAAPAAPDPAVPRILLANLDYNTTEHDIDDFFRAAGVDVKRVVLVKVSPGNRVNGNAYVYVLDLRSVDVALDLDGAEFRGRKLRVSTMPEDQRTVCVRGMPRPSSEKDVRDLFRGCNIVDARSRPVKGGPPDMNTWFVDFADEDSFRRALDKDRSLPGLTICIATAQGRGTPRSREYRDNALPPDLDRRGGAARDDRYRDDPSRDDRAPRDRDERPHRDDRQPRDDRARDERALEGRDSLDRHPERSRDDLDRHPRDEYDRRARNDSPRRYDRRAEADRNGDVGNGFSSRQRAHSRSRSPPARYERERRYDRHEYDRRDRRGGGGGGGGGYDDVYDRHRDRRYSPDYYRDREYDRDYERRDRYRRDYDPRYERDYHRRERDYGRDYRRDSRGGSRYEREAVDPRYERERKMDPPLDPAVTTVLTNLPFCEDRERVVDTLARTLEDLNDALMIKNITPVGRRCGACIVVFRDEESYGKALAMNSITISTRKVNILPLEVPSVARVQKLQPGFIPEDIIDDMRRNYGVESLYIKLKQSDQLLLGIEDSRFLVRLLDIDGRPLLHSRYATVSYIPSRNHANDMGGRSRRSPHDDFGGPGGRGGGGGRDRDGRDEDEGPPDRRRFDGGDRERRESGSDHGRRDGADREARGYSGRDEWRVQFVGPNDRIEERLVKNALTHIGLEKLTVVPIDDFTVEVHGGNSGESTMRQVLDLPGMRLPSAVSLRGLTARPSSSSSLKKRPPPPLSSQPRSDFDSDGKAAKKMKRSEDNTGGSGKVPTSLQAALTDRFYVSPMTPPPGDTSVVKGKTGTPDPELPQICERLETLRSAITGRGSKNSDGQNYAEFCGNLKSLCEPQVLKYTTRENTDPLPPVVWTGTLSKGSKAACNGYLVLRSTQGEEYVKKAVTATPKDVKVEFRGRFDDEKFDHLLTSEAVVVVVKAQEEDNSGMDSTPTDKRAPRSREYFKGILQSLRNKQRLGIGRYVWEGQKYLSLCIPPNPYVFKKLRLPWRYQDFAGHDSLLLVVGPKSASQKK